MIAFLSSRTDPITSILHHIGNSSISDLILKLVNLDENADAAGVIKVNISNSVAIISKIGFSTF